jgi:hypothetical protein
MRDNKDQFNMYFPEGIKSELVGILSKMNEGKGSLDNCISLKDFMLVGVYLISVKKYPELSTKLKDSIWLLSWLEFRVH